MNNSIITFNVLIKKEDNLYIAHCLELDIVTASDDVDKLKDDIIDLLTAQLDYAFNNDNIENLYKPAPLEVWREYFKCEKAVEIKHKIKPKTANKDYIFPHFLISKNCYSPANLCHV